MNLIDCQQVSVALDQTPILHNVTASLAPGETVALLGVNGSGKTTLLRAILGLVPHQKGQIKILGTPIDQLHDWRTVGYVPQRSELQVANATVREVVTSGRLAQRKLFRPLSAQDRQRVALALAQVHLTEHARAEVKILSGGQRQRVMIARALAGQPQAILLDEPLSGLDITAQDGLTGVLSELKTAGTASLIVLHELGPLEPLIDRAIVLREGRVIHDGPLQDGPGAIWCDPTETPNQNASLFSDLETYLPVRKNRD